MGYGHYGRALGSLLEYNKVGFTPVDVDRPLTHAVDLLLQVVPTQFIRMAFETNSRFFTPETIVVNAAKGIEKTSQQLPHQIIRQLGYRRYYSLMGPSFAGGIVDKDPTLVSLGYTSDEHIETILELLQTPYFRMQRTANYQSLELAAALKNVYAILCGYAEGLGFGANTRAKLITVAIQEILKLGEAMGYSVDLVAPGIVGDLVLTCSSRESRNYQFGFYLSTMSPATALKQTQSTVEGFHSSQPIQALSKKYGVELPAANLTQQLLDGGVGAKPYFHQFVQSL